MSFNHSGLSALMEAAIAGDYESAVANIGDVRKRDSNGNTALMRAAIAGCGDIVELLIPHEARMRNYWGSTALMHAVRCRRYDIALMLAIAEMGETDGDNRTALWWLVTRSDGRDGEMALFDILSQREAGIEDYDGTTCLMLLAKRARVSTQYADMLVTMIRKLIPYEKGMRNRKGETALEMAVFESNVAAAVELIPYEKGLRTHDDTDILELAKCIAERGVSDPGVYAAFEIYECLLTSYNTCEPKYTMTFGSPLHALVCKISTRDAYALVNSLSERDKRAFDDITEKMAWVLEKIRHAISEADPDQPLGTVPMPAITSREKAGEWVEEETISVDHLISLYMDQLQELFPTVDLSGVKADMVDSSILIKEVDGHEKRYRSIPKFFWETGCILCFSASAELISHCSTCKCGFMCVDCAKHYISQATGGKKQCPCCRAPIECSM